MNILVLLLTGVVIAAVLAACINYEALSMLSDQPSSARRLGVVCGASGITCMALLPFMPLVALAEWFGGEGTTTFHLALGLFWIAIGSTFGSLVSVLWASRLQRGEA